MGRWLMGRRAQALAEEKERQGKRKRDNTEAVINTQNQDVLLERSLVEAKAI